MHNLLKQNRLHSGKGENEMENAEKSENQKVVSENKAAIHGHGNLLDQYVPLFMNYLDGKYIKVTTLALRCLLAMLKFSLPSMKANIRDLAAHLFGLLRTFSNASSTSLVHGSEKFELLLVAYKLIANLLRDYSDFPLTGEQLQHLLHYAERNLYDVHKQASTFNLLKAIVSRSCRMEAVADDNEADGSSELADIMARVMKLSVQAESAAVRMQSRHTVMAYMTANGAGQKRINRIIEFYIVQLNYEYEDGRESTIEMLATMFNTFSNVIYQQK